MVRFNSLIYTKFWLSASVGVDAPNNDLNFYKNLLKFRAIDHTVADAALKKFQFHLWYLTQEFVVFSLFSNKLDMAAKIRMAEKLATIPLPKQYELGKPIFLYLNATTTLEDLLGEQLHTLFHILRVDTGWLRTPPIQWDQNEGYIVTNEFVHRVKVVNYPVERGVN